MTRTGPPARSTRTCQAAPRYTGRSGTSRTRRDRASSRSSCRTSSRTRPRNSWPTRKARWSGCRPRTRTAASRRRRPAWPEGLSPSRKGLRRALAAGDAEDGNHSRWSNPNRRAGRGPAGHGQPYPAASSSAPSGVSTCRTAPPWRRLAMRPASRSTAACWLAAASEIPARRYQRRQTNQRPAAVSFTIPAAGIPAPHPGRLSDDHEAFTPARGVKVFAIMKLAYKRRARCSTPSSP